MLVHCLAGRSHSVTVVAANLMYEGRGEIGLQETLEALQAVRPCVKPSDAFLQQLAAYEIQARGPRCVATAMAAPSRHFPLEVTSSRLPFRLVQLAEDLLASPAPEKPALTDGCCGHEVDLAAAEMRAVKDAARDRLDEELTTTAAQLLSGPVRRDAIQ